MIADSVAAVLRNRQLFDDLVNEARRRLTDGRLDGAVTYATSAAEFAWLNHPGIFASEPLESFLRECGLRAIAPSTPLYEPRERIARVLHVLTRGFNVGGHTRLLWRWIRRDAARTHSLAVTKPWPIPAPLLSAVASSGGEVHRLYAKSLDLIQRAASLSRIAAGFDCVVLHINPDDPLPILAFADREKSPPVVFMHIADHVFNIGTSVAAVVAEIRNEGARVSLERRGMASDRNPLLPLPLDVEERTLSRTEAKTLLGFSPDDVVILSVSSAYKFLDRGRVPFVEVHLPLVLQHRHVRILVVGPDATGDWHDASLRTNGRFAAVGVKWDLAAYYQAADIYAVSFPFGGLTSLLEAGACEVPLISYREGRDKHVLAPDDPALDPVMECYRDVGSYQAALERLIVNETYRTRLGIETAASIRHFHTGSGWSEQLETVYALALQRRPAVSGDPLRAEPDELDVAVYEAHHKARKTIDLLPRLVSRVMKAPAPRRARSIRGLLVALRYVRAVKPVLLGLKNAVGAAVRIRSRNGKPPGAPRKR